VPGEQAGDGLGGGGGVEQAHAAAAGGAGGDVDLEDVSEEPGPGLAARRVGVVGALLPEEGELLAPGEAAAGLGTTSRRREAWEERTPK
jgi:hypothetical protein